MSVKPAAQAPARRSRPKARLVSQVDAIFGGFLNIPSFGSSHWPHCAWRCKASVEATPGEEKGSVASDITSRTGRTTCCEGLGAARAPTPPSHHAILIIPFEID